MSLNNIYILVFAFRVVQDPTFRSDQSSIKYNLPVHQIVKLSFKFPAESYAFLHLTRPAPFPT